MDVIPSLANENSTKELYMVCKYRIEHKNIKKKVKFGDGSIVNVYYIPQLTTQVI